jgi:hypothetical protein
MDLMSRTRKDGMVHSLSKTTANYNKNTTLPHMVIQEERIAWCSEKRPILQRSQTLLREEAERSSGQKMRNWRSTRTVRLVILIYRTEISSRLSEAMLSSWPSSDLVGRQGAYRMLIRDGEVVDIRFELMQGCDLFDRYDIPVNEVSGPGLRKALTLESRDNDSQNFNQKP